MRARVNPGAIRGSIIAPSSKSMTQRAYAAALLRSGTTTIYNAGSSDDELAAFEVIQQLGATIVAKDDNHIEIVSHGVAPIGSSVNCGESGLAARLFTPIAALSEWEIRIDGRGSLLKRPMDVVDKALPALGVTLTGFSGYIPFSVSGPIVPRSLKIDASGGSQFLSGLLFALSSCATGQVVVEALDLKSRPYIDLTLDMLALFGKPIQQLYYRRFIIDPALFTTPERVVVNIEGDWSSAAFFLVAAAIAGEVTINNLQATSKQADRAILDVLALVGAEVIIQESAVTVRNSRLSAFEFDATHCPDLFPILAILAACCHGDSHIRGVHRLFYKESNRVESITEMLQDFAVPFSVEDDTLFITGVDRLQGTMVDAYNDHRIVMAAAVGALRASGPVDITHPEVVNKSYPSFFDHLTLCGVKNIMT